MQIFVKDPIQADNQEQSEQFLVDLKHILEELEPYIRIQRVGFGNIGLGADIVGFLLWLTAGSWFVFSQGKNLEENLDVWLKLTKKLKIVLSKIHAQIGAYRISKELAIIIAMGELFKKHKGKIKKIELLEESKTSAGLIDWRPVDHLDHEPNCFYHFRFRVNGSQDFNITIISTGKVTHSNSYPSSWNDFYKFDINVKK